MNLTIYPPVTGKISDRISKYRDQLWIEALNRVPEKSVKIAAVFSDRCGDEVPRMVGEGLNQSQILAVGPDVDQSTPEWKKIYRKTTFDRRMPSEVFKELPSRSVDILDLNLCSGLDPNIMKEIHSAILSGALKPFSLLGITMVKDRISKEVAYLAETTARNFGYGHHGDGNIDIIAQAMCAPLHLRKVATGGDYSGKPHITWGLYQIAHKTQIEILHLLHISNSLTTGRLRHLLADTENRIRAIQSCGVSSPDVRRLKVPLVDVYDQVGELSIRGWTSWTPSTYQWGEQLKRYWFASSSLYRAAEFCQGMRRVDEQLCTRNLDSLRKDLDTLLELHRLASLGKPIAGELLSTWTKDTLRGTDWGLDPNDGVDDEARRKRV